MRKIQCHEDDGGIWSYYVSGQMNPCGCGSNCYHYEYDGRRVYGVCNACKKDIYEVVPRYESDYLTKGVWKMMEPKKGQTLEQNKIDRLYKLLYKIEDNDHEAAAALRWAIFTLEQGAR